MWANPLGWSVALTSTSLVSADPGRGRAGVCGFIARHSGPHGRMWSVSENEIVQDVKRDVEQIVDESRQKYVDNGWPYPDGEHAVSEFAAGVAGALSPFGSTTLPLPQDELLYTNPMTIINT
ncbi:hypothetical protein GCM10010528_09680 [Gordonia defluvii]|uniref:Uncharacterized protein n=1 Tax=Gordonia defluvii TaxID=283718 RepID=A0ABP6L2F4_9ACTN